MRLTGSHPFLLDPLTRNEPADCSDGPRAFSPQRLEPGTMLDGFVRVAPIPPAADHGPALRRADSWEVACFFLDLLTRHEPADYSDGPRAFSRLSARSGWSRGRCLMGSFVWRQFHPLRATGPRSGGEVHGESPVPRMIGGRSGEAPSLRPSGAQAFPGTAVVRRRSVGGTRLQSQAGMRKLSRPAR